MVEHGWADSQTYLPVVRYGGGILLVEDQDGIRDGWKSSRLPKNGGV